MHSQPTKKSQMTEAEMKARLAQARYEQATKIAIYKLSQAIKAVSPGGESRRPVR